MSVRRLSQSFLSTRGRGKGSTFVAGYGFGVDEMDLLQRVTVGAGGAATIAFSSIPQTYQHLQIRVIARGSDSAFGGGRYFTLRFNGDSSSNYSYHELNGNGGATQAVALASQTSTYFQRATNAANGASIFGASIIDILDYSSTTKNKVIRNVGGYDANGSGLIYLVSGAWLSTSAITSMSIALEAGNFVQHTVASLYGVVG